MDRTIPIALLAAALSGCASNDGEMDATALRTVTSIECHIDGQTRTTAEDGGAVIRTLWADGDCIEVTDLNSAARFTLADGTGTTQGVFHGSIASSSQTMYGIYPASASVISGNGVGIRIPSVQNHSTHSGVDIERKNLMVGSTSDAHSFRFRPLASLARFDIDLGSTETFSSVTMRCENECIAGPATFTLPSTVLTGMTEKSITLTYADPVSGADSGGWIVLAPTDFSSGSGRVFYDITTDKGTYTICRRPSVRMERGRIYTFPLHLSAFTKVSSATELADGRYMFTPNTSTLTVRLIRATDSTLTIAWSKTGFPANYSTDIADKYTLHLMDAEGNEVVSWAPDHDKSQCYESKLIYTYSSSSASYPPRWCFTGLDPETEYAVYVRDVTTGVTSATLHASTSPEQAGEVVSTALKEGDVILKQNFSKLIWNGDIVDAAGGYGYPNYAQITDYEQGKASGDWTSTTQTTFQYNNRSREQNQFTTIASTTSSMGLGDWGYWRNPADDATSSTSTGTYAHTGYMKIGLTKVRAGLVTPEMKALLGTATLRISFRASPYGMIGLSTSLDQLDMGVAAMDDCKSSSYRISGTTIAESDFLLPARIGWEPYTVELQGVTPTSRIVFFGSAASVSSKNNRFCIDDIRIELVRYEGTVDTGVPVARLVESDTTSATIEWTSAEKGTFTVSLYSDAACSKALQTFTTQPAADTAYVTWPNRFTFTYLDKGTTYHARVKSPSGKISKPLEVKTTGEKPKADKAIVSGFFDHLYWGGDYIRMASALNLTGATVGGLYVSDLQSTLQYCSSVGATTDGPALSAMSTVIRHLCGLDGWDSANAYTRPGYVKVGTATSGGWIATPAFEGLLHDKAEVTVSFKACPYVTDNAKPQASDVTVSLLDTSGQTVSSRTVRIGSFRNQPGWEEFSTSLTGAEDGYRVRIASSAEAGSSFCIDDVSVTSPSAVSENVAYGHVTYSTGGPAKGVVVSNGFSCTTTDENGYYSLECSKDVWYIYYSLPADCEVEYNSLGQPCFFRRYTYGEHAYDFTLTPRSGGKESSFTMFCLADVQCKSTDNISRFTSETVPVLKSEKAARKNECYGVTLGDVAFSSGARNTNPLMPNLRTACSYDTVGFPIFQTMGNHDYTYFYGSSNPNHSDETSSTPQLRAQREFETVFGPINYSWNRSDTHIVCMRDIVYTSLTDAGSFNGAFTDEQYRWLEEDLKYVPKDKMVILCVHIPLAGNTSKSNVTNVFTLLSKYTNPLVMAGHTHYMNHPLNVLGLGVDENVHAAVCGAWWISNLNGDGCPNGFGVYDITGNRVTDSYYKGVNTTLKERSYQIRIYRGNMYSGGKYEYFQTQYGSDVILANVFNSSARWTIRIYENGSYSGNMTLVPNKKYNNDTLPYVSTVSPTMVPTDSSQDWWSIGYHIGVVGMGHKSGGRKSYMTTCTHMYRYTLKNPSASVRVEATDELGNTYVQNEVMPATSTTDYYPKYIVSGNH